MAKSRVKSNEEYDEILGHKTSKKEVEVKKTHDASRYFDDLREDNKPTSNPFERSVSLEEIRRSINKDEDNIKLKTQEQIPVEFEMPILSDELYYENLKKSDGFSFEENARQLYENLRGSHLNKQTKPVDKIEEVVVKKEDTIIELEPISILNEDTYREAEVLPETQEDDLFKTLDLMIEEEIEEDNLYKTEEIDISSELNDSVDTPIIEPILEPKIQEDLINAINQVPTNNEIPIVNDNNFQQKFMQQQNESIDDIPLLNKSKSEALTKALDQEKTMGLNVDEIRAEKTRRESNPKTKDYLITAALIISILVVIYFIYKTI